VRNNKRTHFTLLKLILPNLIIQLLFLSQAHATNENWGLKQTATTEAWKISRGSKKIVVAIIDTGLDVNHPALKDNLWTNPKEILNGIDDDGNGLIDDIHGWDFTSNSSKLMDHHGHGTHIAGIIKSVAPEVSLMALKYYDPQSPSGENLKLTVQAIEYAVKMKVDIINYSGGGLTPSDEEKAAIKKAQEQGILFIAAAGNEYSNSDNKGFYPASYGLSNIISVTAIGPNMHVLKSSNYGANSVDIAAPGQNILSTLPGGHYGQMTGTSQATAFVTGVAALIMSRDAENKNISRTISSILNTGSIAPSLTQKTRYGTSVNAYRALAIHDRGTSAFGDPAPNLTPSALTDFTISN
jgi:thermitase